MRKKKEELLDLPMWVGLVLHKLSERGLIEWALEGLKAFNLKRGDIYHIQWKDGSEILVRFKSKRYEEGYKSPVRVKQTIFSILASADLIGSNQKVSPYWAVATYKKVDEKDLPLYLYFTYKSTEFMKLLKGV